RLAKCGQKGGVAATLQCSLDRLAVEIRRVAVDLNLDGGRNRPGSTLDVGLGGERFRRAGIARSLSGTRRRNERQQTDDDERRNAHDDLLAAEHSAWQKRGTWDRISIF